MPSIEEIAMDEQFLPAAIDAGEFDEIWRRARG
ncbi:DUF6881 domain-containing protein [Jatrophihabitans telluris]